MCGLKLRHSQDIDMERSSREANLWVWGSKNKVRMKIGSHPSG